MNLKAYFVQFTDELTPQMEWLNDKAEQINKPLTSDSAEETERLVERVESVISQLEKKKKVSILILSILTLNNIKLFLEFSWDITTSRKADQ